MAAAAGRADRAAAASTEPGPWPGRTRSEPYFEQGEAPLAAPVMISKASFAEA
jgi:hypothetical protein